MQSIDDIKEQISDIFKKNNKLVLTIIILLTFMSISAFFILFSHTLKQNKKPKQGISIPEPEYSSSNDFIPPQNLPLSDEYYFSRVPKDKWTKEDADEYFEIPNQSLINELENANDSLVNEILGAVP